MNVTDTWRAVTKTLDGMPAGHWVIAVELADRSTRHPPEDVPESPAIEF